MKNINLFVLGVAVLALFLTSCSKQPEACFNIPNGTHYVGDPISITNCSVNADNYEWEDHNGMKTYTEDISYTPSTEGNYTINLKASNDNGSSDQLTKSFSAVYREGSVIFSAETALTYKIDIYVGGTFAGTLTSLYDYYPPCGTSGCVTLTLPVGTYSYYATNVNYAYPALEWSGTVTISQDQCFNQGFTFRNK